MDYRSYRYPGGYRLRDTMRPRHGFLTWIVMGLVFEILFYHHQSFANPLAWLHILIWPLFLALIALKWFIVMIAVIVVVGWLLF